MKRIEVVAAVIEYQNKFLCVQRNLNKHAYISKKYEFPGGKIEAGESPREALKREILEELKMEITPGELVLTVEHQYPDFFITMHGYLCHCLSANYTLTEHLNALWLTRNELLELDWAEADIPIVKKIMAL